jgi:hypothetical protein
MSALCVMVVVGFFASCVARHVQVPSGDRASSAGWWGTVLVLCAAARAIVRMEFGSPADFWLVLRPWRAGLCPPLPCICFCRLDRAGLVPKSSRWGSASVYRCTEHKRVRCSHASPPPRFQFSPPLVMKPSCRAMSWAAPVKHQYQYCQLQGLGQNLSSCHCGHLMGSCTLLLHLQVLSWPQVLH